MPDESFVLQQRLVHREPLHRAKLCCASQPSSLYMVTVARVGFGGIMLDKPQEAKQESKKDAQCEETLKSLDRMIALTQDSDKYLVPGTQMDKTSDYLPNFALTADLDNNQENLSNLSDDAGNALSSFLLPEESIAAQTGEKTRFGDAELFKPIDDKVQKALMKDADEFPPIQNPDGSTTYTVVQAGITDRENKTDSIDYYKRVVNVTVPKDQQSLANCDYFINPREIISKDEFDKIVQKDKASSPEVELYAHGVSNNADSTDKQSLMLQLSNGRPTIALDWTATPVEGSNNPFKSLKAYAIDTIAAKRANDNKAFEGAIDDTVAQIGADHTDIIGFSHGGYFSTRYLHHRVEANLPKLHTAILTHPDVPVSAPELQVNGKPELLRDAAEKSYVIGGRGDLALKVAVLASHLSPGTPTYNEGQTEERLGNDSAGTRDFINKEGAEVITERERSDFLTQHFLNTAGIRTLLDGGNSFMPEQKQDVYNAATDLSRLKMISLIGVLGDYMTPNNELLWQNSLMS